MALKFRCPLDKCWNEGKENEPLAYEKAIEHGKQCQHRKYSCKFCKVRYFGHEMEEHLKDCMQICEKGCELMLKKQDRVNHDCITALRDMIQKNDEEKHYLGVKYGVSDKINAKCKKNHTLEVHYGQILSKPPKEGQPNC